jgi:geranylgeranyl transferase type-2 subunit alpha
MLNLVSYVGHPTLAPALTQEERAIYIIREIDDIKDLLEDYPDYKLIYEALLDYTLSLCQVEGRKPDSAEKLQLVEWLEQLKRLDPMRDGRWTDLEKDCGLIALSFGKN